ncbi:MAG: hypothetical protein ACREAB_16350, partial [Blastocatellia bacterium]
YQPALRCANLPMWPGAGHWNDGCVTNGRSRSSFILSAIERGQLMEKLSKILLPLGLLCFVGALGMAVFSFFLVIAASFGFEWPFYYFQYLGLPAFAIGLPAMGILAFFPLALRQAFAREVSTEKDKFAEPESWRGAAKKGRGKFRLRPV